MYPGKYPKRFEKLIRLKDGTLVFLRPVKPSDVGMLKEFYKSLSLEQKGFYDKLIRHKENEFIQRSIELTLAKHRLRAMNNVATNYCIEFDANGKEVGSADYREELRKEYTKIRLGKEG